MRVALYILFYFTVAAVGITYFADWVNTLPTVGAAILGVTVGSVALVAAFLTDEVIG